LIGYHLLSGLKKKDEKELLEIGTVAVCGDAGHTARGDEQ